MIFLFKKIKMVQIRDEMAMGIKRACEWACWGILIWSIKQSIRKLSVRSMCQKLVPRLRQNAFTYRKAYSFEFEIFFHFQNRKKIQILQLSRGNISLKIIPEKKLEEIIRFQQKLLVKKTYKADKQTDREMKIGKFI